MGKIKFTFPISKLSYKSKKSSNEVQNEIKQKFFYFHTFSTILFQFRIHFCFQFGCQFSFFFGSKDIDYKDQNSRNHKTHHNQQSQISKIASRATLEFAQMCVAVGARVDSVFHDQWGDAAPSTPESKMLKKFKVWSTLGFQKLSLL